MARWHGWHGFLKSMFTPSPVMALTKSSGNRGTVPHRATREGTRTRDGRATRLERITVMTGIELKQRIPPPRLAEQVDWILERLPSDAHPLGCWLWDGPGEVRYTSPNGTLRRLSIRKAAFTIWKGALAPGMTRFVRPTCGNERCVNPRHLRVVGPRGRRLAGERAWQARIEKGTAREGEEHPCARAPDWAVREAVRRHVIDGETYPEISEWMAEQGFGAKPTTISRWAQKLTRARATAGLPAPPPQKGRHANHDYERVRARERRIAFLALQGLRNCEIAKLVGVNRAVVSIALRRAGHPRGTL